MKNITNSSQVQDAWHSLEQNLGTSTLIDISVSIVVWDVVNVSRCRNTNKQS